MLLNPLETAIDRLVRGAEDWLSRTWVKVLLFLAVFLLAWLGGMGTAHAL